MSYQKRPDKFDRLTKHKASRADDLGHHKRQPRRHAVGVCLTMLDVVEKGRPDAVLQAPAGPNQDRTEKGSDMADSQRICSIDDCCNAVKSRGMCNMHYLRLMRHGDPLAGGVFREPTVGDDGHPKLCIVNGCDRSVLKRNLCNSHYKDKIADRAPRSLGPTRIELSQKIASWVDGVLSANVKECVEWPFGYGGRGYGAWTISGNQMSASRAVLVLASGEDPQDLMACHGECHNPKCVNPNHLYWGDKKRNSDDRLRDGTFGVKLTLDDVKGIRASDMRHVDAAKRWGVTANYIACIRRHEVWK